MTQRDKDDVARALEALSAGQHHEETGHEAADHAPPTAAPKPARPAAAARPASAARPAAPTPPAQPPRPGVTPAAASRPTTPTSVRPAAAVAARPAAPAASQTAAKGRATARPAAPGTPRAATVRPAGPPAARPAAPAAVRPAGPTAGPRPAAPPVAQQAAQAGEAPVDDDAVIVPAPDASVFFHKPDYAAKNKRPAFGQSVRFRQTLIPILLTSGLIMVVLGALHFLWSGENNPMEGLPVWLVAVLFLFGLLLWGLATANMLSVKAALDAQRRKAAN